MGLKRIILGSRGSRLALVQTERVKEKLLKEHPGLEIEVKIIRTRGDHRAAIKRRILPGIFVKELEVALLAGEIDAAVHSLKDLPIDLPPGLHLAAVPERLDPRDALISRTGVGLKALPSGALLGTGSPRRRAQILALRSDLKVADLRGNVDTRLRKLRQGDYEAIVVAYAALIRLGLEAEASEVFSFDLMLPAPGQGALALEARSDNERIINLLRSINDVANARAVKAERAFLKALGGGCRQPLGAFAEPLSAGRLGLCGVLLSPDGKRQVKDSVVGRAEKAPELGRELALKIGKEKF